MIFKAYYDAKPLMGLIRTSQLNKGIPAKYVLTIVHGINGLLVKKEFTKFSDATAVASNYGCTQSKWNLTNIRSN